MSTYFIGDIHGCYKNLKIMLDFISFNPSIDVLYLTGDLVSRGPDSLKVLRLIHSLKNSACTVLGNHDLYLLKTYFATIKCCRSPIINTFHSIIHAPDANELMYWLRTQPILHIDENKKILMTHAGIYPKWSLHQVKQYAQEIESILTSNHPILLFTKKLYKISNTNPTINIKKLEKIQNNINFFTKMRYIEENGKLNTKYKNDPKYAPKNIHPWFDLPRTISSEYNIIFGHWASLKKRKISKNIYGLDSGCCWGESLTALRWEDKKIINIPCSLTN